MDLMEEVTALVGLKTDAIIEWDKWYRALHQRKLTDPKGRSVALEFAAAHRRQYQTATERMRVLLRPATSRVAPDHTCEGFTGHCSCFPTF